MGQAGAAAGSERSTASPRSNKRGSCLAEATISRHDNTGNLKMSLVEKSTWRKVTAVPRSVDRKLHHRPLVPLTLTAACVGVWLLSFSGQGPASGEEGGSRQGRALPHHPLDL